MSLTRALIGSAIALCFCVASVCGDYGGPCKSETSQPGFLQTKAGDYLDVDFSGPQQYAISVGKSQRYALYTRHLLRNTIGPGCPADLANDFCVQISAVATGSAQVRASRGSC